MKPVNKGTSTRAYKPYDTAKPELLAKLGKHCSYCERFGHEQDLHVEHIYPKDPHPERESDWNNFLIACNSCNSYKNSHLGNKRRRGLERRYIWPHLDNTFNAFEYDSRGGVEISAALSPVCKRAAESTREMVGMLLSPAKAKKYQKLGLAYDGANKRSQMWGQASGFLRMYSSNPTPDNAAIIANGAAAMGHFSIWMKVFSAHEDVRRELIRAFDADIACFDSATQPVRKGRF